MIQLINHSSNKVQSSHSGPYLGKRSLIGTFSKFRSLEHGKSPYLYLSNSKYAQIEDEWLNWWFFPNDLCELLQENNLIFEEIDLIGKEID